MNMMTIPEVARVFGVTRCRAWQMLKEKKFKAVKFSHVYAVKESEVNKLLKAKKEKKEKNHENPDDSPAV